MTEVTYAIKGESTEFNPVYVQSYLGAIGWNRELVSLIQNHLETSGEGMSRVFADARLGGIQNTLEKLGMIYLGKELMDQEARGSTSMGQLLTKFHLYHWLYDCVACLDAVACMLNATHRLDSTRKVAMNKTFIELLAKKNESLSRLIKENYGWMKELKRMRDNVIHRESPLITGGGAGPSLYMDLARVLGPNLDLDRLDATKIVQEYTQRIDWMVVEILRGMMVPERSAVTLVKQGP